MLTNLTATAIIEGREPRHRSRLWKVIFGWKPDPELNLEQLLSAAKDKRQQIGRLKILYKDPPVDAPGVDRAFIERKMQEAYQQEEDRLTQLMAWNATQPSFN